jgi:glycerol kinase
MKLLKIAALSATLLAGGCATEMAWQREDGGPLDRRFAWAAERCRAHARETWGDREDRAETMYRCMRRHGYVWTTVAVQERRHHRDRYYEDYDD